MANIRTGSIVSDIRGSCGTETYSRNASGPIVRNRTTPANPNTLAQQAARAVITALSQAWSGTLDDDNRAAWRQYAHQWPRPDKWGSPSLANGYTAFIRHNALYYREHSAILKQNPPDVGPLHPPGMLFTVDSGTNDITIALPPPLYDPPPNHTILYAFAGLPVSEGVGTFTGPWRYVGHNERNGAWATDPWTVPYPFAFNGDRKCFAYMVAQSRTSGALSTRSRAWAVAT